MNRCAQCKFWGSDPRYFREDVGGQFRDCACPKIHPVSGGCEDFGIASDVAYIEKSIDSYLMTGANFGCVHFETKPESSDA